MGKAGGFGDPGDAGQFRFLRPATKRTPERSTWRLVMVIRARVDAAVLALLPTGSIGQPGV